MCEDGKPTITSKDRVSVSTRNNQKQAEITGNKGNNETNHEITKRTGNKQEMITPSHDK